MDEYTYCLSISTCIKEGEPVADNMRLDIALILLKALMEEYYQEEPLAMTISRRTNHEHL